MFDRKKSKRKLGKQEKRKTELQGKNRATGQKQSYSVKFRDITPGRHYPRLGVANPHGSSGLIQHPTPRRDARRLGVDEATRKKAPSVVVEVGEKSRLHKSRSPPIAYSSLLLRRYHLSVVVVTTFCRAFLVALSTSSSATSTTSPPPPLCNHSPQVASSSSPCWNFENFLNPSRQGTLGCKSTWVVVVKTKPRGQLETDLLEGSEPFQVDATNPAKLVPETGPPNTLRVTLADDNMIITIVPCSRMRFFPRVPAGFVPWRMSRRPPSPGKARRGLNRITTHARKRISNVIELMLEEPWIMYLEVPADVKKRWLEKWAQKFTWANEEKMEIKKSYDYRVSRCYQQIMSDVRVGELQRLMWLSETLRK
ncbi:hypothetical protein PIB30_070138 [Stylosanthes scabra]|uniref:Uncharacterized protein n=1 Tax=Stylosanthes scabra TaxID=79078 RepID=A0ABU6VND0_9FABA|nr:hypothetical protein [Stylosanthes scabra]